MTEQRRAELEREIDQMMERAGKKIVADFREKYPETARKMDQEAALKAEALKQDK